MIENLFLSVGAMKAGTTWLYDQLKDHADIYFTPEKEIHYFANKIGIETQLNQRNRILRLRGRMQKYCNGNPKYIAQHLDEIVWYANYAHAKDITDDWYKSLFAQNPGKRFCADFSNLYCQMPAEGWDNVHRVANNVKVIYTLRDPLSRLWSHYKFHMKWTGKEEQALDAGFENFKELINKPWFWANSEYPKNYKKLRENLSDDQLMVLYFEDFRLDPKQQLQSVQDFLGITVDIGSEEKLEKKINKTRDFDIPGQWRGYMEEILEDIYRECQELNLFHPAWGGGLHG